MVALHCLHAHRVLQELGSQQPQFLAGGLADTVNHQAWFSFVVQDYRNPGVQDGDPPQQSLIEASSVVTGGARHFP